MNGGRDGDLYLNVALRPHPLFAERPRPVPRPAARAWEAVLGTTVQCRTLEDRAAGVRRAPARASSCVSGAGAAETATRARRLLPIVQIARCGARLASAARLYGELAGSLLSTRADTSRRRRDMMTGRWSGCHEERELSPPSCASFGAVGGGAARPGRLRSDRPPDSNARELDFRADRLVARAARSPAARLPNRLPGDSRSRSRCSSGCATSRSSCAAAGGGSRGRLERVCPVHGSPAFQ